MRQLIDCYGHPSWSERYLRRGFEKRPCLVETASNGVTYICFDETAPRAIHRIQNTNGVTTIQWAYGQWEDRTELDYNHTLNEPLEVDWEE